MNIIAHRGYWKNKEITPNTKEAICLAIDNGYGFETDFRDYKGNVVISHDIADEHSIETLEIFNYICSHSMRGAIAINIKSDGLKHLIKEQIDKFQISNYFLFDMSIPQMVEYRDLGLKFFTRQSEMEISPCLYDDASGVWIDGFYSYDWITEELLEGHISNGKEICIVSPELHGHAYNDFWARLNAYKMKDIMLCTDYPDEAKEFFYG